ncbi:MAG: phosphoenolpyruvate carboxykinase (ATP) [Candidatus Eisenbacteria bacterium]|uniref:Phosphoenolpyruvate carboxykinase (ATP) n=1 Tax=Eiseniibacteriota bacterium TaxID=2212470 RepID=A0A948W7V7_UNCEI|nr:phosphoenolpyruvate carboxykinase (ATP) [Candidatus Eisenbacteria bacterium]MBU1947705.1 phosphoenolpyruvate carboxykinase (ATP) [Candidatus Eisenbacteria bacterium]MBU2692051.1 phosphoenolpyruvate carboxykinase (ATP) [Candidatus Eisenbacteria bacterium]
MSKYLKFDTPGLKQAKELKSDYGIDNHGLEYLDRVYWNLPTPALVEEAVFRNEGHITSGGAMLVYTGKWTARAAQDKYVVKEPSSEENIWWGEYNRPYSSEKFAMLFARIQSYLQGEEVFVQDCFVGADPEHSMPIRIITEKAWQSHFARNMFLKIRNREDYKTHVPEFTLIAVSGFKVDPRIEGTRTETAIAMDFSKRMALVCNSKYGGEIKKSIFTVMNYFLPLKGVLSMHCSANIGDKGDAALFFGLSGTGKTTLSADPTRQLIGDDEHGWSDDGVFNLEGGCYAKVIRLSSEHEPQIHACTHRFGTILENVVFDPASRNLDLDDDRFTENTRCSYPLNFIPNVVQEGYVRSHPKNVIFLTCDAQGVLPPLARLDPTQSIYHFISGYTSKIAGTEIGLGIEPEITFSACFGAPFMVHHPFEYANMLKQKALKHGAQCWLVNTGWVGGKFGVGKRISIRHTRNLLNAALEGKLDGVKYRKDKLFGFEVPLTCPDVPEDVLDPSNSWGNKDEYWKKYDALVARYIENFKKYKDGCPEGILEAGPKRLK